MEEHTCNKEHEIDGLSRKVDGIYKTINGNDEGDGMKVQLATVSVNLLNLVEKIGPMVDDMKEVKEFMTTYRARQWKINN